MGPRPEETQLDLLYEDRNILWNGSWIEAEDEKDQMKTKPFKFDIFMSSNGDTSECKRRMKIESAAQ